MSLANTLVTNEVKDYGGTEVEFSRISSIGRSTEFAAVQETPATPVRLKVSHQETGVGINKRRRSVVRFDLTTAGQVDSTVYVTHSCYAVLDIPIGNMTVITQSKNVVAYLMSFMASLGASTTILYDCTGNGAATLLNGTL
jgi:hypothetical protein